MANPRIDKLERNLLMNGGFGLWQRAGFTSASNTTTSLVYSGPDRWRVKHAGTFTGTPGIVRDTNVPSTSYPNSMRHGFQRNASAATLNYEQRIESIFSSEILDFGKVSFSLYVRPDIAGTIVVTLYTPTVIDNHASQNTVYTSSGISVSAASWQLIQLPNISLSSGVDLGLAVNIQYTSASGTDGGVVNFRMTRAMLNLGSTCIPFQRHGGSQHSETLVCQRYYEKSYNLADPVGSNVAYYTNNFRNLGSAGDLRLTMYFKVQKRVSPTTTSLWAIGGTASSWNGFAVSSDSGGEHGFCIIGSSVSVSAFIFGHWAVDAEL